MDIFTCFFFGLILIAVISNKIWEEEKENRARRTLARYAAERQKQHEEWLKRQNENHSDADRPGDRDPAPGKKRS